MNELHEAHQLVFNEGPDELALVKIGGVGALESFEVLSKMSEASSLPNRGLIINDLDSPDQLIIENHTPQDYSLFLRLTYHIPRFVIDLTFPPLLVVVNWKNSEGIPLQVIAVPWFRFGDALCKC